MQTVNEYLKEIRINKNISLRKVNKLTGLPIDYLYMLENTSEMDIPSSTLKEIALVYGVRLNKLYGRIDKDFR